MKFLRNTNGTFKAFFKPKYWFLVGALGLFSLAIGGSVMDFYFPKQTINYVAPVVEAAEITPETIELMKWDVVDRLEACEGGGHTWEEGFIKMDVNTKLSYSPLQWQMNTAKHYANKRDGSTLNGKAALDLMMEKDSSRKLAYDVIFVLDVAPSKDWFTCSQKNGLDALASMINKFDK